MTTATAATPPASDSQTPRKPVSVLRQALRLTRTEFTLFYRYQMALYSAALPLIFLLPLSVFEPYDVLPGEMPGVKANGEATLVENIADLGGVEIAYQAFLNRLKADGYTDAELKLMKQRFFLAYAEEFRSKYGAEHVNYVAFGIERPGGPDMHSMDKERVNGVVANMDGWYDAFDIKDGALYRKPADRIRIW